MSEFGIAICPRRSERSNRNGSAEAVGVIGRTPGEGTTVGIYNAKLLILIKGCGSFLPAINDLVFFIYQ